MSPLDPVVASLNTLVGESAVQFLTLAKKSGVAEGSIRNWLVGRSSPRLHLLTCVLEALRAELWFVNPEGEPKRIMTDKALSAYATTENRSPHALPNSARTHNLRTVRRVFPDHRLVVAREDGSEVSPKAHRNNKVRKSVHAQRSGSSIIRTVDAARVDRTWTLEALAQRASAPRRKPERWLSGRSSAATDHIAAALAVLDLELILSKGNEMAVRVFHKNLGQILDALHEGIVASGRSYEDIGAEAGVSRTTIKNWFIRAHSPRLADLEAALQVVGYKLEAVPKDKP